MYPHGHENRKSLQSPTTNIGARAASLVISQLLENQALLKEQIADLEKQSLMDSLVPEAYSKKGLEMFYDKSGIDGNGLIVVLDLDGFKSVNDNRGHLTGDRALKAVGSKISNNLHETLRRTDLFGRWGGDEFVILLPDTDKLGGEIVCNKVSAGIKDVGIDMGLPKGFGSTISYAAIPLGADFDSAFEIADNGLRSAKNNPTQKGQIIFVEHVSV